MVKKVKLDDTYESLRNQFNEAVDQIQEMQESIDSINQEQQNQEYVKSIAINGSSITITKNDDTTETLDVGGKVDMSTLVTGLATSGTTITITYGDGHTATITTQDTNTTYGAVSSTENGLATPALLSTANNAVPKSGATMTGALVGQANTNYTTAQFRNITMSNAAPTGGSNGQVHFQYS